MSWEKQSPEKCKRYLNKVGHMHNYVRQSQHLFMTIIAVFLFTSLVLLIAGANLIRRGLS